jgi:hypothetical protein
VARPSWVKKLMQRKTGILSSSGVAQQTRPDLRDPYEQCTLGPAQSKTRRRTPQGNAELVTEKKVLGFKLPPRLKHVGDEHSERVQDRKHHPE